MSDNKNNKSKKDNIKGQDYYGGLTFKQFKNVGNFGIQLSDIAWAGRIFHKYQSSFNFLNRITYAAVIISILCLLGILYSLFTRPPALLMAVYPNGQVVCAPKLVDLRGRPVSIHRVYHKQCNLLSKRAGKMWDTSLSGGSNKSNDEAVGNINNEPVVYIKIEDLQEFNFEEVNSTKIPGME